MTATFTTTNIPNAGTPVQVWTTNRATYTGRVLATANCSGGQRLILEQGAGRWHIDLADVARIKVTGPTKPFGRRHNHWTRPARLAFEP